MDLPKTDLTSILQSTTSMPGSTPPPRSQKEGGRTRSIRIPHETESNEDDACTVQSPARIPFLSMKRRSGMDVQHTKCLPVKQSHGLKSKKAGQIEVSTRSVLKIGKKKDMPMTQCYPAVHKEFIDALTGDQKDMLRKLGFGGLLLVDTGHLNRNFAEYMVVHLDPDTMKLQFGDGKEISVDEHAVHCVFGLPKSGDDPNVSCSDGLEARRRVFSEIFGGNKVDYTPKQLCQLARKHELSDENTVRAFLMSAFCAFLLPNTDSHIRNIDVVYTEHVQSMCKINWCKVIVQNLELSARMYKNQILQNKEKPSINGCVIFLIILYLDHMKHADIQDHITIPRCKFYTKNMIDRMIAADFRPLSADPKECYGGLMESQMKKDVHTCYLDPNGVLIHPLLCHNDVVEPPKEDHIHSATTAVEPRPVTSLDSLFLYPNSRELLGPLILRQMSSAAEKKEADKWMSNYDSQCARAISDMKNAMQNAQANYNSKCARAISDMRSAMQNAQANYGCQCARAISDMQNAMQNTRAHFYATIRGMLQEDLAQTCNGTPLKHVYKRKKASNKSATDQSSRGNACTVDNKNVLIQCTVDSAHTSPVIGVDGRSYSEDHAQDMDIDLCADVLQSHSPTLHTHQILQSGEPETAAFALLNLNKEPVALGTTPPYDDFVTTRDDDQSIPSTPDPLKGNVSSVDDILKIRSTDEVRYRKYDHDHVGKFDSECHEEYLNAQTTIDTHSNVKKDAELLSVDPSSTYGQPGKTVLQDRHIHPIVGNQTTNPQDGGSDMGVLCVPPHFNHTSNSTVGQSGIVDWDCSVRSNSDSDTNKDPRQFVKSDVLSEQGKKMNAVCKLSSFAHQDISNNGQHVVSDADLVDKETAIFNDQPVEQCSKHLLEAQDFSMAANKRINFVAEDKTENADQTSSIAPSSENRQSEYKDAVDSCLVGELSKNCIPSDVQASMELAYTEKESEPLKQSRQANPARAEKRRQPSQKRRKIDNENCTIDLLVANEVLDSIFHDVIRNSHEENLKELEIEALNFIGEHVTSLVPGKDPNEVIFPGDQDTLECQPFPVRLSQEILDSCSNHFDVSRHIFRKIFNRISKMPAKFISPSIARGKRPEIPHGKAWYLRERICKEESLKRTVLIFYSPEITLNGEDIVKSFCDGKAADIGLVHLLVHCLFHDNLVHCPKRSGDCIYLDPDIYFFLNEEETKDTVKSAETRLKACLEYVDAMEAKLIFLPIYLDKHFFALCINMIHKRIDMMDPLDFTSNGTDPYEHRKDLIEKIVPRVSNLFQTVVGEQFPKIETWSTFSPSIVKQQMKNDFLFFVWKYMDLYDGDKLNEILNPYLGSLYRAQLLHYLLFHPINQATIPHILDQFRLGGCRIECEDDQY